MRQWGMFAGGSGCQELSPVGGRSAETLVLEGVSQQLYDGAASEIRSRAGETSGSKTVLQRQKHQGVR